MRYKGTQAINKIHVHRKLSTFICILTKSNQSKLEKEISIYL